MTPVDVSLSSDDGLASRYPWSEKRATQYWSGRFASERIFPWVLFILVPCCIFILAQISGPSERYGDGVAVKIGRIPTETLGIAMDRFATRRIVYRIVVLNEFPLAMMRVYSHSACGRDIGIWNSPVVFVSASSDIDSPVVVFLR